VEVEAAQEVVGGRRVRRLDAGSGELVGAHGPGVEDEVVAHVDDGNTEEDIVELAWAEVVINEVGRC
jgi:hypothetical protein